MEQRDGRKAGAGGKPRTKILRQDEPAMFLGWRVTLSEWSRGEEKLKLNRRRGRGGDREAKKRT